MTIVLTKEDCHCGLVEFYENVARKAGINFDDRSKFDCSRLLVTKRAQFEVKSYYHNEEQMSEEDIGIALAQYGPKAALPVNPETPYMAEIQDGFCDGH